MTTSTLSSEITETDAGWFEESQDVQMAAVEQGLTTVEKLNIVGMEWRRITNELKREWTLSRLNQYWENRRAKMLHALRKEYSDCTKRIVNLELENRDARIKGVPFKDRQHYAERSKRTQKYMELIKDKGEKIKRTALNTKELMDMIEPGEMYIIAEHGLEYLLDRKYPDILFT